MNRLVIIGNGFDLAHGLETRYEDFLNDYLATLFFCAYQSNLKDYKSELIKVIRISDEFTGFIKEDFDASIKAGLSDQNNLLKRNFSGVNFNYKGFVFNINSDFFGYVLLKSVENWVDFEKLYFDYLLFNFLEFKDNTERIIKLNRDFGNIENELKLYLSNTKISPSNILYLESFKKAIRPFFIMANFDSMNNFSPEKIVSGNILVVNFNYTDTVNQHIDGLSKPIDVINIHGSLSDDNNPVIFGYGDYHHQEYTTLENAYIPSLMEKMKSMHYPKTHNYSQLIHFLNTGDTKSGIKNQGKLFEVLLLGHSGGLSDRNLLRTVFEHPNCDKIHITYHKDSNDHFLKTIELSRHFQNKEVMLNKIQPFNDKLRIPQLNDFKSTGKSGY